MSDEAAESGNTDAINTPSDSYIPNWARSPLLCNENFDVGEINAKSALNGKNKKFSAVSARSRKQVIYASVAFVLYGVFAVGVILTMFHLAICISLAVAALTFLAVGYYCLYEANTALSSVEVKNGVDPADAEVENSPS